MFRGRQDQLRQPVAAGIVQVLPARLAVGDLTQAPSPFIELETHPSIVQQRDGRSHSHACAALLWPPRNLSPFGGATLHEPVGSGPPGDLYQISAIDPGHAAPPL